MINRRKLNKPVAYERRRQNVSSLCGSYGSSESDDSLINATIAAEIVSSFDSDPSPSTPDTFSGGGGDFGGAKQEIKCKNYKTPKCPECGKKDLIPSSNPNAWYCAKCLKTVWLK